MDVKLKHLPKSRIELNVTVPAETMAEFFAAAKVDLAATVELPGFRKGHGPEALVLERIGEQRLTEAALDRALPRTYTEAVRAHGLIPLGEPTIHVKQVGREIQFQYLAEVDVYPAVDPGKYQAVRVNANKYAAQPPKAEEVDAALLRLRRAAATTKEVDRQAKIGDLVEVTYTGRVGGVVRENLQSRNHPVILGEGMMIQGFDEALIGLVIDEEKIVELAVPTRDKQTELVTFTIKLSKISEIIVPELDQMLAERFGKASPAEVRETLEKQLANQQEREAHTLLENAVLEAVFQKAKVDLPETLITHELHRQADHFEKELKRMDQTLNQWLTHQKKTHQQFLAEIRPRAELAVKSSVVLRAIAEKEGFLKDEMTDQERSKVIEQTVHFLVEQATK